MNELQKLLNSINTLRGPNGCQWDKEQTIDSIKPYLLEETYEVIESILDGDFPALQEELGDLLCQIVFLAQLAKEKNKFSMSDVIKGINQKLINRHPHVFGELKTTDTAVILKNWEKIKANEANKKGRQSILDGIPKTLPGLTKAFSTQEKASRVGFDCKELSGTIEKVEEEIQKFKQAIANNDEQVTESKMGDILFSLVNISRFLSIDPEFALQKTTNKFASRFQFIEKQLKELGQSFENSSIDKINQIWEKAKELEEK